MNLREMTFKQIEELGYYLLGDVSDEDLEPIAVWCDSEMAGKDVPLKELWEAKHEKQVMSDGTCVIISASALSIVNDWIEGCIENGSKLGLYVIFPTFDESAELCYWLDRLGKNVKWAQLVPFNNKKRGPSLSIWATEAAEHCRYSSNSYNCSHSHILIKSAIDWHSWDRFNDELTMNGWTYESKIIGVRDVLARELFYRDEP